MYLVNTAESYDTNSLREKFVVGSDEKEFNGCNSDDKYNLSNRVLIDIVASPSKFVLAGLFYVPPVDENGVVSAQNTTTGHYELSIILPDQGMLILKDSLSFGLHSGEGQENVSRENRVESGTPLSGDCIKRSCMLWDCSGTKIIILLYNRLFFVDVHFLKSRITTTSNSFLKSTVPYKDLLGFVHQNREEVILRQTLFVLMIVKKEVGVKGSQLLPLNNFENYGNHKVPFYCMNSRFKNNHSDEMHVALIDGHGYSIINLEGDVVHAFQKTVNDVVPDVERTLLRIEDEDTHYLRLMCDKMDEIELDDIHSLAYSSSSSDCASVENNSEKTGKQRSPSHDTKTKCFSPDTFTSFAASSTANEFESQSKSTMIHTLTYCNTLQGFVIIFYDGSMSFHHYVWNNRNISSPDYHGSNLLCFRSPRTHFVSLVAYPFPLKSLHKSLQDNFIANNGTGNLEILHPVVYERNALKDYFSSHLTMKEVNKFLLLSESLQRTILRSKLVVTAHSIEEISRVLNCVVVTKKNSQRLKAGTVDTHQADDKKHLKAKGSVSKNFEVEEDPDSSTIPFITPSKPPLNYNISQDDNLDDINNHKGFDVREESVNIIILLATKHTHANDDFLHEQPKSAQNVESNLKHENDIVSYSLANMTLTVSSLSDDAGSIRVPSLLNLTEHENPSSKSNIFCSENNSSSLLKNCDITNLQVINLGHSYVKRNAESIDLCSGYTMKEVFLPDHATSTRGFLLIQFHGMITCRDISNLRIAYFSCRVFESHPSTDLSYFSIFALNRLIVGRSSATKVCGKLGNTESIQNNDMVGPEGIKWKSSCELSFQEVVHCPNLADSAQYATAVKYLINERSGALIALAPPHDSMIHTSVDNYFGFDKVQSSSIQPFMSSNGKGKTSSETIVSIDGVRSSVGGDISVDLPHQQSLQHLVYNPANVVQCVATMESTNIMLPKALLNAYYELKFHSAVNYNKYGLLVVNSQDRNSTILPHYFKEWSRMVASTVKANHNNIASDYEDIGFKYDEQFSEIKLQSACSSNFLSMGYHFPFVKPSDFQNIKNEKQYIACAIGRNVNYRSSGSSSLRGKAFGRYSKSKGGIAGSTASSAYHQLKACDEIIPELWIYSSYTKRWRNIILALADHDSSNSYHNAMVVRDIYSVDYKICFSSALESLTGRGGDSSLGGLRTRTNTDENIYSKSGHSLYNVTQVHAGSNPLQHPPDIQTTRNSFDNHTPSIGNTPNLRSIIHQVMNPTKTKSQLNHNYIQILYLHWFGTHSIVLVTIRKSQSYIEILSREPLKDGNSHNTSMGNVNSLNPQYSSSGGIANGRISGLNGHLLSKFHYLIPLPPGFVPIYMDCLNIDQSDNNEDIAIHKRFKGLYTSCVILVSDGRYYNAYQVNARYNNHNVSNHLSDYYYRSNSRMNRQDDSFSGSGDPATAATGTYVNTSINIVDYSIVELWSYTMGNTSGIDDAHLSNHSNHSNGGSNYSLYHNLKNMKALVQVSPINDQQEQSFLNIFSIRQGGMPFQLHFVAMVICDSDNRIYYVDPVHNAIQLISAPSVTTHIGSSSSLSTVDADNFQILHKNQLTMDLVNHCNATSVAVCNDAVLLTSVTPQYDVVGNYKACFVSLLTKYNLLQKFCRKGINPNSGLRDDPFKPGEKRCLTQPGLNRLWFHFYDPCTQVNSFGNATKQACDRVSAVSIDLPVYTSNHTMPSADLSSDPISSGLNAGPTKMFQGVSYCHNLRRHTVTSQSFLFQLYMSITVTLFHLEHSSYTSTSISGPQSLLMMLQDHYVFFDQRCLFSITQKCVCLRQWLKLLLDQGLLSPKTSHILHLSIETSILSMIPNITKKKNTSCRPSSGSTGIQLKYSQFFKYFIGLLYEGNPHIYYEVISRICRKIEYNICYDIFPLPITRQLYSRRGTAKVINDNGSQQFPTRGIQMDNQRKIERSDENPTCITNISLVDLFERSLSDQTTWHASRILTLLCEYVGGTETSLSVACCLLLSSELLYRNIATLSLKKAIECIDFIHRLEQTMRSMELGVTGKRHDTTDLNFQMEIDDPLAMIMKHITNLRFQNVDQQFITSEHNGGAIDSNIEIARESHGEILNDEAKTSIESGEAFFAGFDWILSSLGLISSPVNKKSSKRHNESHKVLHQQIPCDGPHKNETMTNPSLNPYNYEITEKLLRTLSVQQLQELFFFDPANMKTEVVSSIVGHIIEIVLKNWWGTKSVVHTPPATGEGILGNGTNAASSGLMSPLQHPNSKNRHCYASAIFTVLIFFSNRVTKECIIDHVRSYVKAESRSLLEVLNPKYGIDDTACYRDIDVQTDVEVAFKNLLLLFRLSKVFSSASPLFSDGRKVFRRDISAQQDLTLREFALALQGSVSEQYIRRLIELELHPVGHHCNSTSFLNLSNHSSTQCSSVGATIERDQRRSSRQFSSDGAIDTVAQVTNCSRPLSSIDLSMQALIHLDTSVVYLDLPGSIEDVEESPLDSKEQDEHYDHSKHPLAPFFHKDLLRHPHGSQRVVFNECSQATSSSRHYTIFHVLRSVVICALMSKNFELAWYIVLQLRPCFPIDVQELIQFTQSGMEIDETLRLQNLCDIFVEFILQ